MTTNELRNLKDYSHRVVVREDNLPTVRFQWHWPRGTFDARMSAMEIAAFLLPHMPDILPFFSKYPQVYQEFQVMLLRLATWPTAVLDEAVPWIQRLNHDEEDEIIQLDLGAWKMAKAAPTPFVMGVA